MISVVIPAHDEAELLGPLLARLVDDGGADLDIVVVANGCTDHTAEVARSAGRRVRVIETPVASKAHALRLGDAEAAGFPRVYLDADVDVTVDALRRVADALESGPLLAAAPRLRVDVSHSSWAVRAYYSIWLALPYHRNGMIGSGLYALSEAGRSRFAEFPDLIADDGFVRLQFSPEERGIVEETNFTIRAPHTLRGVLAIKTRSRKGDRQLRAAHPELVANDPPDPGGFRRALGPLLRDPRRWPALAVYVTVVAITTLRVRRLEHRGDLGGWERDHSTRVGRDDGKG